MSLAHACGEILPNARLLLANGQTQGIWLKPKHLMRLFTSEKLHAHTSDACVQAFFASLIVMAGTSQERPDGEAATKRKWYFRVEYKRSAMRLKDGMLELSNGKGNAPLILDWPWKLPQTVVIHWTGTQYEAIATYKHEEAQRNLKARR